MAAPQSFVTENGVEGRLDAKARCLEIGWPDGRRGRFAFVWLRHAALCPRARPNDTVNKLELLPDDPATLAVSDIRASSEEVILTWADGGLVTEHALADLRQAACPAPGEDSDAASGAALLWDAAQGAALPIFDAGDLEAPETRLAVFLALRDAGLVRLRNLPPESGRIAGLAAHFGTLHENNYGRLFDVQTASNTALGANSAGYLGPHTDENYRHAPPGINFFHCLRCAADGGGESILVDGFAAARRLQARDPEAFALLCRQPVAFRRHDPGKEDMRSRGRIIVADPAGALQGIRFTDRTIFPQDLPPEAADPFYRALKAFWNLVNGPDLQLRYQLQPGELHIFDNQRVLHGRTAFDPAAGPRHLQQCSVNRDEFHNNLRLLAAELGHPAAEAEMTVGVLG